MQFNEDKLISLMENFSGTKFQWIKTNRPELLGKVVTCRTIEPRGTDKFFAIFDDGSSVDTAQLNTSLLMLHGDMEPLSRAEVESISGPRRPATPSPSPGPIGANIHGPGHGPIGQHHQPVQQTPPQTTMFDMFNSEESNLALKISIKLPDQDLLKLMYLNAKDKDNFLNELSEYVFRVINKKVVQESISSIVVPVQDKPARAKSSPIVNITEIHED